LSQGTVLDSQKTNSWTEASLQTWAAIAIDIVFIAVFFYALSFARPDLNEKKVGGPLAESREQERQVARRLDLHRKPAVANLRTKDSRHRVNPTAARGG
jgi:hypothetical protein